MSSKVLVTDFRHANIEKEKQILSAIGAKVYAGLYSTEEEVYT